MNKYYSSPQLSILNAVEGDALPSLNKHPSQVDVVRFCAAIRNFHRFHYDQEFTSRHGLADIIVPGFLIGSWCIEIVSRSFGPGVEISKLKFRNTSAAPISDDYVIEGRIETRVNQSSVLCALEVRQVSSGEIVTTATVGVRERSMYEERSGQLTS